MQSLIEIDSEKKIPKYLQIVNAVTESVKKGKLKKGDRIFSINELSNEFFLSRDTVQKAYDLLEEKGIIEPVKGKGFYINRTDITSTHRILLQFNKISNYKKQVYNSFVQALGDNTTVDLKIYHSNTKLFEDLLGSQFSEYDYYVIMPHFYEDVERARELISKIPTEKLLLLDKDMPDLRPGYAAVFQDFRRDISEALETGIALLKKYERLILVHPKVVPYPHEIVLGFRSFCMQNGFAFDVIQEINPDTKIKSREVYIVIEETDLVNLIKGCRSKNLKPGKDIGIISYNDTPLKEILLDGITVISTDHARMGESAARLILENKKEKIKNPFKIIQRKSL